MNPLGTGDGLYGLSRSLRSFSSPTFLGASMYLGPTFQLWLSMMLYSQFNAVYRYGRAQKPAVHSLCFFFLGGVFFNVNDHATIRKALVV